MQRGSLIRKNHKQGPDVWQFRWSEKSPESKRVYRKRVIGTVEQYLSEGAARSAVVGLVAEINSGDRRMYSNLMTVSQRVSIPRDVFRWRRASSTERDGKESELR
jgi:integrase